MIPYANARLTKIQAVSGSKDYDQDTTLGEVKFAGRVGIYAHDELAQTDGADGVTEREQTRLEIPYQTGRGIERGDRVTFTLEGAEQTRVVKDRSKDRLVGRVRVVLEDR